MVRWFVLSSLRLLWRGLFAVMRFFFSPLPFLGSVASVIGIALVVYFAKPIVTAPDIDRESPLQLPFVIANESWVTFYSVWPNCKIDFIDLGWIKQTDVESSGLERWGDLGPGDVRRYVCPVVTFEKWKSLHVTLDVYFELHLIPGLPWRQHKIVPLEAVRDSEGNARFVPEQDITGRVGHPITSGGHAPAWERARRVPWDGKPKPDWDALERMPHSVKGMLLGRPKEDIARDEMMDAIPPLIRRTPDDDR